MIFFELQAEELTNAEMQSVYGGNNTDKSDNSDSDNRDSQDGIGVIWP